jgi:hypothetical protein
LDVRHRLEIFYCRLQFVPLLCQLPSLLVGDNPLMANEPI